MFDKIEKEKDIPKEWNPPHISSIYKKGNKRSCVNYRGISVIPTKACI
jgi:hypothetical protein